MNYFEWVEELFDFEKIFEKPEALEGVRVLDTTVVLFGPEAGSLLAEFGAEVIRIEPPGEPPGMGDFVRSVDIYARFWKETSQALIWCQRNKYFTSINLRHPKGRDLFLKLVKKSDVVLENFVPGTMDRLGLSYRYLKEINPKLIYLSLSGYGQWGERWNWPSFDASGQAMSGASAVSGYEGRIPLKLPFYPGDLIAATAGFMCTLAALYYREKTGKGQYIDVSQVETFPRIMGSIFSYVHLKGEDRKRMGNRDPSIAPSNMYQTLDEKLIVISTLTQDEFRRLCKAMRREDLLQDERFARTSSRLKKENADEIDRIVAEWVSKSCYKDIIELAKKYGFSVSPVRNSLEVYEDIHLRGRRSVWLYDDPIFGSMVAAGSPAKLSRTPGRIKWTGAPVGYHNRYVLKKLLGLTEEEIEELVREGVVVYWADFLGRKPPKDLDYEKDPMYNW
ncbi:MAG: CoA transferase [Archaeoglobus sp.]|nr:CoA transferase [Archaeoglobus sp.]